MSNGGIIFPFRQIVTNTGNQRKRKYPEQLIVLRIISAIYKIKYTQNYIET